MSDYQITAIRPDGNDTDRRIDAVQINGTLFPIDRVIGWIQSGEHRFWVLAQARSVWVMVGRHTQSGRYYLTTEGDGFPPNNLLNLPRV
ncbi:MULTISPECIES: DUF3892 domain-containing protein [unclassified Sphingopyxis]|uniref:DUF3892 domain-containing protein n=1 Tax=unclassified Sphingopyxis TaxID=2614943 RepID=UPI0007308DBD|nr:MULTISPECIES: DUF3892 domain-containing protein [unclassified Sphingopyxis]KTE25546.1 hypothetical protein ATE61_10815 [Sphingopyxis sp. H057]KTE53565.1 hypothetical protein ATE64_06745 [Sphingopyxis sp. H073]KTE56158.1 hypothetical protein ATE69_06730 [Sphingopyxis sp. H071]KTE61851.1 hypothetical protein ATE66_03585 [Sphingopyxis sp. H107]KTE67124.1 hypothetical protein ATE65_03590 [Sphingopyxis sp. H100]